MTFSRPLISGYYKYDQITLVLGDKWHRLQNTLHPYGVCSKFDGDCFRADHRESQRCASHVSIQNTEVIDEMAVSYDAIMTNTLDVHALLK